MARNYYTLVAGLREWGLEAENKGFDARGVIDEIEGEIGAADRGYLALFYTYHDIENIICIMAERGRFSVLGNFDRETLAAEIKNPAELPPFIAAVLRAYADPDDPEFDETDRTRTIEKALFTAFYAECARSKNSFIREWYEFDRNLRNLLAAYAARKAGLPIAEELVGEGYVVDMLAKSSAADFGLRGELSYIDDVLEALTATEDMLEKETRLDRVRWHMADSLTEFDYFNMNAVLAYLAKVNLVQRWMSLDRPTGERMLRELLDSLTAEVPAATRKDP